MCGESLGAFRILVSLTSWAMDSGTGKPEGGLGADCRSLVRWGGDGQGCVLGTSEVGVGLTVAHGGEHR